MAAGNVDSFVSVPGAGVQSPGVFLMVVGTSICDLVIDRHEARMPGITGVVENGILPGFFGYEAGQAAVGDMFAWFGSRLLGLKGGEPGSGGSWHEEFEREAAKLRPGSSGLVALDWWNGNRTILGDADLSGVIVGLTLATTPVEIYRALLESVAFGTRRIVENFIEHDVAINEIVACGGIAERSALDDAAARGCDRTPGHDPGLEPDPRTRSRVVRCARRGLGAGRLRRLRSLRRRCSGRRCRVATSRRLRHRATYDEVYSVFGALHDVLGREHVEWLHHLKQIRRAALAQSVRHSPADLAEAISGRPSIVGPRNRGLLGE